MKVQEFKAEVLLQFGFPFTPDQDELIDKLHEFLYSTENKKVFVLQGYAGTGKTSMVSAFVRVVGKLNYSSMLLAPTGRAAKVISGYSKRRAFTIHKMIYTYKYIGGRNVFVLKKNTSKNTIFIVDEASMIGDNSYMDKKSLLDDLMEFVYEGKNCVLIFVGDTAQLPPVHESLSKALDWDFLNRTYYTTTFHHKLEKVVRQNKESGILFNATEIRNHIANNNLLPILDIEEFDDVDNVFGNELQEHLEDAYSSNGLENAIVLCRSNKRANLFNQHIRARILFKEEELDGGDLMMVIKNNYHWIPANSKAGFIANGDIIEVKKVQRIENIYGFRFATAQVKLVDYPDELPFETKLMMDAISINETSIPRAQLKQLYYEIEKDYLDDYPGRRDRMEKVLKDPYFNALQVKFAYAVTCHKSQGGQWESVFIDQGYLTEKMVDVEYLRWLYTAFTRATKKLYLANFSKMFFKSIIED
jgi:exodeoxyribonuclease-5